MNGYGTCVRCGGLIYGDDGTTSSHRCNCQPKTVEQLVADLERECGALAKLVADARLDVERAAHQCVKLREELEIVKKEAEKPKERNNAPNAVQLVAKWESIVLLCRYCNHSRTCGTPVGAAVFAHELETFRRQHTACEQV